MANAKRYRVIVGAEIVYVGPIRTAEVVYSAIRKAFSLSGSSLSVTLAFDL